MSSSRETSKTWIADAEGEVELLRGSYRTHRFDRHWHASYSLGIILDGSLSYDYRGSVHTATAGAISIIHPGEVHTGYSGGDTGWTYRNFFLGSSFMRRLWEDTLQRGSPFFENPVIEDPPLARSLIEVHRVLEVSRLELQTESVLIESLVTLAERHGRQSSSRLSITSNRPAIRRACDFLQSCHMERVSLREVAGVAGYSPFHFLRIFRSNMGMTPHEYLRQVRIDRARAGIAAGRSIADVAMACGFSDQSHLTRCFKRVLGVTPGQYARGRKIVQEVAT